MKSEFKSKYNFLKFSLDDFEISRFNLDIDLNSIKDGKMVASNTNFLPIRKVNPELDDILQITEREKIITLTRMGYQKFNLDFEDIHRYYISSILDGEKTCSYSIEIPIEEFKNIGFNTLLELAYYEIEAKRLRPNYFRIIKRLKGYPEYVEVNINNEQKYLTRINIENGINSFDDLQTPLDNTICREDGNILTAYILSGNKIHSKGIGFAETIKDEDQKKNFIKYMKRK